MQERQLSHQFRDDYVFLSALNSDFKRLFGVKGSWLNGRLDVQAIQGVIQKIADTFAARSLRKSETISSEARISTHGKTSMILILWFRQGLEVLVKSVQFTMLAHGVLEIAGSAQTSPTVQYHLRSPEVWAEGKRFADALIAHVIPNTQKQSDSESLSTQWQRFLDFLRSNSVRRFDLIVPKLPKIYPGLRKHIGRIRRPYYLQALTLVNECRTLAEAFSSQTDKVKAQELLET
ncbi:hypothetical protein VNI00_007980 [Paramarasmius palmivorus]|uniref:Uncharacterized protein n=1 Tax=Paramarasmius palmivorus TaxID=297713 RepID=A0AAW0CZ67_9AGAR